MSIFKKRVAAPSKSDVASVMKSVRQIKGAKRDATAKVGLTQPSAAVSHSHHLHNTAPKRGRGLEYVLKKQTYMNAASGKLFQANQHGCSLWKTIPKMCATPFLLRCPYSLHVRAALSCQVVAQLNDFLAKQLSKKFEPVQVGHVMSCRVVCMVLPAVANECEDGCMLVHAPGVAGQSPMGKTVWRGVALPSAASMHMLFS